MNLNDSGAITDIQQQLLDLKKELTIKNSIINIFNDALIYIKNCPYDNADIDKDKEVKRLNHRIESIVKEKEICPDCIKQSNIPCYKHFFESNQAFDRWLSKKYEVAMQKHIEIASNAFHMVNIMFPQNM